MVSLRNGNGKEVQLYYKVTSPLIHLSFKWQEFEGKGYLHPGLLGSCHDKTLDAEVGSLTARLKTLCKLNL